MAVTENLYTGDGSTVLFSFTFPYLNTTDVKVSLDDVDTTAYSLANATQVQLNSAPASGVAIRIFRDTNDASLTSEFFPGAAIKSDDLNNNFTQNLYVTQESNAIATKATTTANTAKTTADSASTTATSASTTATSAASDASTAVTTANTAATNASSAVTTANSAVTTANAASATATAAQNAVANALFYTPVANVSSIPGSPSDEDRIEISNSTGIESFSPLNGLPSGFTGSSDLVVRLEYDATNSRWDWKQYFADDPEARYFKQSGGTITGSTSFDDDVIIKGDSTNGSGKLTLNCENNSHGVNIKGPPHSAGATYTLTLPTSAGTNGQFLSTDGSGGLSWGSVDLSTKADIASPTFTGTPAVPTASQGTNSTQIASTAYVQSEIGQSIQAHDADTAKTDVAQSFTAAQRGSITTLTDAATVTPDFAASNNFALTFTSSVGNSRNVANPTNLTAGQSGSIFLVQDGTGSRSIVWGSYWDFAGGTAPTLTTTANAVDRIDYVVRSSTSIHAVATLNYS